MALTLLEASKVNDGTELEKAIVEIFARESDVIRALPFVDISGNALKFTREGALPSAGFRGVNEAYTESTGSLDTVTDALTILGGDIDIDKFLVDTMGADQRTIQRSLKAKAMSAAWATKFIKGDVTSNPREFDGIQRRAGFTIPALGTTQTIANSGASGGAGLSLAQLDAAIDATVSPTHLIMSRAQRRWMTGATRVIGVAGTIGFTVDEFGRPVTTYAGLPILTPYDTARGTELLPYTEAFSGGGSALATSVYVARLAADGLCGIKNGNLMVRDLGEQQAKPVYRDRVEMYAGITLRDPLALTRLSSISNAAITA